MNVHTYLSRRPMVLGLAKIFCLALAELPVVKAAPFHISQAFRISEEEGKPPSDPSLWLYLGVAAFLVLAGGAFAGLTIALMGQDEIYLQVIQDSGEGKEKIHADKVLKLLKKGKHWVLVTLLLSNVITNETLPIVLDRSLGGGWPAVLGSTVLIVIFGEVVPQSICVRYGLPIGAWMAPFVLFLMYLMAPVAWPTAKLLDYLLGKDHGTVYKKAGLKTLVSLHRSLGEAGQRLHADEVTIISAVLDLKEKPIGSIMTPMDDVFTLSLDDVLDEETMDDILSQGYSRIPIHHPDNDENFVGMLLVKMLITYDPEDAKPVRDFALATLPETKPETSCLDIVNFFQEGKSHMVMVSTHPGEDSGALGVVTLEDVIEELIGEEIVDESDVFVDIHKAIRRITPTPWYKYANKTERPGIARKLSNLVPTADLMNIDEGEPLDLQRVRTAEAQPLIHFNMDPRRTSSQSVGGDPKAAKRAANLEEVKEHLKHLGPSNLASRPKTTRYANVKIKPGSDANATMIDGPIERSIPTRRISESASDFAGGIGEGLLKSGGRDASDGVQALAVGYGSISSPPDDRRPHSANKAIQADASQFVGSDDTPKQTPAQLYSQPRSPLDLGQSDNDDVVGDLPKSRSPYYHHAGPARSGSITENVIDTNGIRKVVLETTSSSESNEEDENSGANKHRRSAPQDAYNGSARSHSGEHRHHSHHGHHQHPQDHNNHPHHDQANGHDDNTVAKRKKRRKKKPKHGKADETQPLLGQQN